MSTFEESSMNEFFILGEDWGLYEEFVPRENFSEAEILAKHSRRYFSKDGRSIEAFPHAITSRKIVVGDMKRFFEPVLRLTDRVLTCEYVSSPDYYRPNSFAWLPSDENDKVKSGIYGEQRDGLIVNLYGTDVRPLRDFAQLISVPISRFCKEYGLILVLHNEYPLDVTDPYQLSKPENNEIS